MGDRRVQSPAGPAQMSRVATYASSPLKPVAAQSPAIAVSTPPPSVAGAPRRTSIAASSPSVAASPSAMSPAARSPAVSDPTSASRTSSGGRTPSVMSPNIRVSGDGGDLSTAAAAAAQSGYAAGSLEAELIAARTVTDEISADAEGLVTLMRRGSWAGVVRLAERCALAAKLPHEMLQFRLCRLFGLVKLRLYKAAADDLETLGNLDDVVYTYEHYATYYPNKKGSLIPFTLRVLQAELPGYLGNVSLAIDNLYALLHYCRSERDTLMRQAAAAAAHLAPPPTSSLASSPSPPLVTLSPLPTTASPTPFSEALLMSLLPTPTTPGDQSIDALAPLRDQGYDTTWSSRETRLICAICNRLLQQRDFVQALYLIHELLHTRPNDATLWAVLGRIHLQLGDIPGATVAFQKVEALSPQNSITVLINKGYLALACDSYEEAVAAFQAVTAIEPNNIVATNNRAICWLYLCQLSKAVQSLEELIVREPLALTESLVFNLCTLYELASERSADKKREVWRLVLRHAPDSFNPSTLKLG